MSHTNHIATNKNNSWNSLEICHFANQIIRLTYNLQPTTYQLITFLI